MGLILQEAATLAAGDVGPDNIKWQQLESIQLPDLEEMSESHQGGGSVGEVEWGNLGIKALAPTFKLKGWDPQVMALFGARTRTPWTVRGALRNKQTQVAIGVRAILYARLGKISPDAFERGKLLSHDHQMLEVVHYELYFDEKEMVYWDHFEPAWRVNTIDLLADQRRLLALPG